MISFDLDKCRNKDELEAYVKETFGVDLDKRKKLDDLKTEVEALGIKEALGSNAPAQAPVSSVTTNSPTNRKDNNHGEAVYVKHHATQSVFHYQPHLAKRIGIDLTYCDKDGNAV